MNPADHHFSALFEQLGLAHDNGSIAQFLSSHAGVARGIGLADAPCWTASQASFLRESLSQDADWSGLVDQLSQALQGPEALLATPKPPKEQAP